MSKMIRIHDDILEFLGAPKDVNAALRVKLGLPARVSKKNVANTNNKGRSNIKLDRLIINDTAVFLRSEHNWQTIYQNVRRQNKKQFRFALSTDVYNLYVTRVR